MNCNEALRILLKDNHAERNEALAFIKENPACLARIDQLGRAIVSGVEYESTCAESRLRFADYLEWQRESAKEPTDGQIPKTLRQVAGHLGRCPYCQLEYEQLRETMAAFMAGSLPAIETVPKFKLDFIKEPLPPMVPTREIWPLIGDIRTLFKEIEVSVSESIATIATLTPQLAPSPISVVLRGSSSDDPEYAVLVLPDEEANIHFQVDSKPSAEGTALVTLRIFETGSDMPLPDIYVTLCKADGARVASSLTDQAGMVSFQRIPPDRYAIKIEYGENIWDLPISITTI